MPADPTAQILHQALGHVLLPIWLAAGFGDWLCHRVQRIEHSAGIAESMLHWLMIAELGGGVLAVTLLEINAGVLLLLVGVCVAHELTIWCDLRYASSRRPIPIYEQWVHGLQTALPWVGLAALLVVHRDQALAIVGMGAQAADWDLRQKQPMLPPEALAAGATGAALLVALPFAEEFYRCWRAQRRSD